MLAAASRIFCINNGAVHFSLFFGQVHKKPCRWFGGQAREDVIDGPATIYFLANGVPRCHIRHAILLKDGNGRSGLCVHRSSEIYHAGRRESFAFFTTVACYAPLI